VKSYCNIIVIIIIIIITIIIGALGVVKKGKENYIGKISVDIRKTEVQN